MQDISPSAGPSPALIDMLMHAVEFAAALAFEYARNVAIARDDATRDKLWTVHESYIRYAVDAVVRRYGLPVEVASDSAAVYLAVDDIVHFADVLHRRLLLGDVRLVDELYWTPQIPLIRWLDARAVAAARARVLLAEIRATEKAPRDSDCAGVCDRRPSKP